MLTLTLLRHAKSSWKDNELSDFDRPLNKKGRKDAPIIASWIAEQNIHPDIILCSSAVRTRETFEILQDICKFSCEVRFLDEFYLIGESRLMTYVKGMPDEFRHILIIAHNPGLHEFALELTSSTPKEEAFELNINLPTAALVQFEFGCGKWSEITSQSGNMVKFVTPAILSKDLTTS